MPNWLIDQPLAPGVVTTYDQVFGGDLVIAINTTNTPITWRRGGELSIYMSIDGELYRYRSVYVPLGRSAVSVPLDSYRLAIEPVYWLTDDHNPTIQLANYNMESIDPVRPIVSDKVYTSVTPPTAANTAFVISAAKARSEIEIHNNTSRRLYIKEGDSAIAPLLTPGLPFASVAPGGIGIVRDYDGIISGIYGATVPTGATVIVRESLII